MEVIVSEPQYLADGRINCIVDVGRGPMPYTASLDDTAPWGPDVYAAALALGPADYEAPAVDPDALLAAERAAMRVSRYQALATLHTEGLLDAVNTHMASQDFLTQLAWAETTAFDRNNALIASVAAALNISDEALDDLFRAGMQLTL